MKILVVVAVLCTLLMVQAQNTTQCGNGILDKGEQCDASVPGASPDCCTAQCQFAASNFPCQFGAGLCQSGVCQTRTSQCAAYDSTQLQFKFPVMPDNITSVGGPFSACSNQSAAGMQLKDLIRSGQTIQQSVLSQLVPANLALQSQCTPSCSGVASNGQAICVDFTQYQQLPTAVPNYLPCFSDLTSGVSMQQWKNDVSAAASAKSYKQLMSALQKNLRPGVCVNGQCNVNDKTLCRQNRCSNKGDCALSAAMQKSLTDALGVSYSAPSNMSMPTVNDASAIQCTCDDGYSGNSCELMGGTLAAASGDLVSKSAFNNAILASVFGTLAALLLCLLCLYCCTRRRRRQRVRERNVAEPVFFNAKKSDTQRQSKLSNIQVYEAPAAAAQPTTVSDKRVSRDRADMAKIGAGVAGIGLLPLGAAALSGSRRSQGEPAHTNASSVPQQQEPATNHDAAIVPPVIATPSPANTPVDQTPPKHMRATHEYTPRAEDEIHVMPGDVLHLQNSFDDGWAIATNVRTGKEGAFPMSFAKRMSSAEAELVGGHSHPYATTPDDDDLASSGGQASVRTFSQHA